jgi:hypothetical protein
VSRKIGNGKDTFLWFDPWVPEGTLVDILGDDLTIVPGTELHKVSELIKDGVWDLSSFGFANIQATIQSICISDADDYWEWKATKSGICTLASAWEQIRERGEIFEFYDMVWFPHSSPKMSACLLKAFNNRLPVRERLKRFGIIQEENCVLCTSAIETRDHLFFQCPYVSYIWSLCKLKLGILSQNHGSFIHEASFIKEKFKSKSRMYVLARTVFQTMIWHIWLERNRRVFHNQSLTRYIIFRYIYEDVQVLAGACDWEARSQDYLLENWGLVSQ